MIKEATWEGLVGTATTADVVSYPALVATVSNESIAVNSDLNTSKLPLVSSKILSERFDLIKSLNANFTASYKVINFTQFDKFYSIAHDVALHRGYLFMATKVSFLIN